MQRGRTALDSFPDLNQGSSPNNASLDSSDPLDNMVNPVENRNVICTGAEESVAQRSSGWHQGDSSHPANNLLQAFRNRQDIWPSSFDGSDSRSEDWCTGPSNIGTSRSLGMQNYATDCPSLSINPNLGNVWENDFHRGMRSGPSHTLHRSSDSEAGHGSSFHTSFENTGNPSGSSCTYYENNDSPGSAFGTWGSSCKRKALEGTPGQFYPGGSSSSNQMADSVTPHPFPGCYTSGSLGTVSPANDLEQSNLISGVGTSRVTPSFFPSSSGPRISESSSRSFTIRSNLAHHDSIPFEAHRGTSARHSGGYVEPSELRSPMTLPVNPTNTSVQPHTVHTEEVRPYPWGGSIVSRGGSSSRSSGERGPRVREDISIRSSYRNNNLEYPADLSPPVPRSTNLREDQIDWSWAPGTSSSRNYSSGSRGGPSSSGRASSSSLLARQNEISQNHHRLSEAGHWILSPNIEFDSGSWRSHAEFFASGSSLLDEATTSQHRSIERSAALLMEMPGDGGSSRASSVVENRQRLIRLISAMRRGGRLQPQDYVLIDPFINGFAELHDRHRDMRLDVDNMSYEELLALEEQIGTVSTGLSEDKIETSMKQRKYEAIEISMKLEPCCICQEDYIPGDDIGVLACAHEFHTDCIKKWLIVKNLCPICKMAALDT